MAINLLSPGIKITEADLTASVTATGTTVGGTAGQFAWGPANEPILVGSEAELGAVFGKPTSAGANAVVDFLSAANFLAYSPNLYVVRAIDTDARNAGANSSSVVLVENLDDYESTTFSASNDAWIAKYPGAIGNSLKVSVCGNTASFTNWAEGNTVFDNAPGTSPWAIAKGFATANDEVHIVVIDEDGKFSGVSGTVLEKFPALSKASDARGADGGSNYYKNVINTKSKYIWWANKFDSDWDRVANSSFTTPAASNTSLDGGTDGTITEGDYTTAYQEFANKQNVTISVMPVPQSNTTIVNAAIAIAEGRKDVMVCFSPEKDDVVGATSPTNTISYAGNATRSTYAIMDANWKYQYDKYNDTYVYVPCASDVAGCLARVDATRAPWFSPAGYTNGRILNAVKLAWNPTQAQRDELYKKGINPIFTQPGRGTVLFGDKTFVTTTGSMSRVNVRRLFIQIEAAIEGLAGDILFEQNDAETRERFVNAVEPYLRTVQGGRGIEEFRVVCDESNNTDDIVTSNGFVADIFVRPIGSINFIQLNFVSVAGAAAFAALG